jgi:hypothetical protein
MVDSLPEFGSDGMLFGDVNDMSSGGGSTNSLSSLTDLFGRSNNNANKNVSVDGHTNSNINNEWVNGMVSMESLPTSLLSMTSHTSLGSMNLQMDEPLTTQLVAGELAADYQGPPPLMKDEVAASLIPIHNTTSNNQSFNGTLKVSPSSPNGASTDEAESLPSSVAPYLLHVPVGKLVGDDRPCPFGCGKVLPHRRLLLLRSLLHCV